MRIILPFQEPPKECLSLGPSQGLVYGLDQDIILKLPFQYEVTRDVDMAHCWDLSLGSFVATEKELAVYEALRDHPHANFARRLAPDQSDCLFLERLQPLQTAWPGSSPEHRHRWVLEFLAAVSWLEKLGFVNGDLAIRNLGVDRANRLKLFDFGSALTRSHSDYSNDVRRDHFNLATCLHFLVSGVDPFADVYSHSEAVKIRSMLESGQWKVAKGASVLADIIQDGWSGRTGTTPFEQLSNQVVDILGTVGHHCTSALSESHYECLESRCREWLGRASRDPLWKDADGASKRITLRATRVASVGSESEKASEVKPRSNGETAKIMLTRILDVLGKMSGEIGELKTRVSEQSDTIRKLSATVYKQSTIIQGQEDLIRDLGSKVQEAKAESRRKHDEHHEETKQEHQDLQREVAGVKEQLVQLMQKPNMAGEATVPRGPRATFADIVRSLPASPPTSRVEQDQSASRINSPGHRGGDEALSAENRVTIGKISWLSKRESGKAYGSMVVYVTKKSDAERLLEGYYFDLAGESATTYVFEPRTGPLQCVNCQGIGHRAYSCKKQRTCGKCASAGHHHKECTAIEPKPQGLCCAGSLEPYARNIGGEVVTSPMGHHNWTKMIPTCARDGLWPIRSMLWIRSDLEAEQVPVPSSDLTAVVLRLEGRAVMVVSVYVQGKNDEALTSAMELLRDLIDRFRDGTGNRTDVVLAGDFNRHDLLWGGDEVSASRQGEGQPIIDLMNDFGLSSLLPRGTKTWQRADEESTIDLVLASAELADESDPDGLRHSSTGENVSTAPDAQERAVDRHRNQGRGRASASSVECGGTDAGGSAHEGGHQGAS
ncbi:hypothetical protein HIM_09037 [Hirsutella minnesotensis 3608]|uniref:CCHC-type domain-containing protein n=1 Tax=Hirsutella minnesotensis 3608 TaxID=1043627 RepID=A0A0F7ZSL4_9HYPO|nr:hypothetical protein HIM_09037 [Hirsutella minnesotensis 3608]